jgi:hypothetical protein
MEQDEDRSGSWTYALVALAALIVGMAIGQLGATRDTGHSRIVWPETTPPHPRTLQP